MPLVTFITHDGNSTELQVESGTNLMQAAIDNGIEAILAECGGACSCATCHCYIDKTWTSKIPEPDTMEKDMLDCVLEPQESSRLSCQIEVTDALNGLVVHLPDSQY